MKKYLVAVLFQFFLLSSIHGQLCTGSLGDPVVNITFGNDNTPKGPLKAGVTNMMYTTSGCPNDGQYGITNLAFGCFGNTWFLLAGDHTGDVGGRYMVINASFEPSDFYLDTVSGLCGNTVYEFEPPLHKMRLNSQGGIDPDQLATSLNLLTFAMRQLGECRMMTGYDMGFGGVGMILMLGIAVLLVFALVKYLRK